jgi:hypothetical protein
MAKQNFLDFQGLTNVVNKLKQFVLDNKVEVDGELSSTSTNPVENGVITTKLDEMQDEYEGLIWSGTQAEYEEALAQGLIKEGTVVNITDDYDDEVYSPIESSDIHSLFA